MEKQEWEVEGNLGPLKVLNGVLGPTRNIFAL